jgi:hypothetical protein
MPREVFIAGQILTAAEMNTVSNQTVMSFAGTAARGSAIPTAVEGMVTYLNDQNILSLYDGAGWKNSLGVTGGILQVVQTVKTNVFTTTSTSFTAVTGFSASITPKSTSSKILVLVSANLSSASADSAYLRLTRGGTAIFVGDAVGTNRVRTSSYANGAFSPEGFGLSGVAPMFLDSPNTASSVSYAVEVRGRTGNTVTINRLGTDSDDANRGTTACSITLLEVAA